MENASKALLIAGAILLVIALIAIGMAILGQGRSVTNQAGGQADAMKVQIHNSAVESYIGERVTGSQIITLLGNIEANNSRTDKLADITPTGVTAMSTVTDLNATYKVTITSTDEGAITGISIVAN